MYLDMLALVFLFIGEFSDIIWAPLSAMIYFRLFGGKMGVFGGAFSFLEELLPFTDIIPTFTISWFLRSRAVEKESEKKLILKNSKFRLFAANR